MKKYQTPEIELALISANDIMTASLIYDENGGAGENIDWSDGQ